MNDQLIEQKVSLFKYMNSRNLRLPCKKYDKIPKKRKKNILRYKIKASNSLFVILCFH